MHPILIEFGPFKLYTYGLFVALGFAAGVWLGTRGARRYGIDERKFQDLAFAILLAAILGARGLFVLLEWRHFADHPLEVFSLWKGGLVFYGGLLGAGATALWYVKTRRLPAGDVGDAVAPGLALGQALGRIGCFFAGCCYGAECSLPWGVTFTDPRSLARLGVPLHPTQLYEAIADLVVAGLLYFVAAPRRRAPGQVFGAYLVLYPVVRFVIEFFRDDPRGALGILSTSQALSIPLFLTGLWILFSTRRKA